MFHSQSLNPSIFISDNIILFLLLALNIEVLVHEFITTLLYIFTFHFPITAVQLQL
ncbi:MAG: hypothetical protein WCG25_08405 [bacterium]